MNPLTGEVTGEDGEQIGMFIDFLQASSQQLQEIRPQDIQRIDIIRSPEDPRFDGARIVANFIMKKYEYGGYSKIGATQDIPFANTECGLYSKLSYKRMTYDISAAMNYKRLNNHAGEKEEAFYKFGTIELERVSKTIGYRRRELIPRLSGRAVYNKPGVTVSNMVGFNFSRNNPYLKSSEVEYNTLFKSGESHETRSRYDRTIIWKGDYYFQLPAGWALNINGNFDWTGASDFSKYQYMENPSILNDIKEEIFNTDANVDASKRLGVHTLGISVGGGWKANKLKYVSSTVNDVRYDYGYGQTGVRVDLRFNRLSINPNLFLSVNKERINNHSSIRLFPNVFIPFYVQPTRRSSLSGAFEFAVGGADASQLSPVLIRINEVEAIRGNADLGKYYFYKWRTGYSHYFGSWLSARAEGSFACEDNILVPVYISEITSENLPVMIRNVRNEGKRYVSSLNLSLAGKYFNDRLYINLTERIQYYLERGTTKRNKWVVGGNANISYFIGNFKINGFFRPEAKRYTPWKDIWTPTYWYIGVSYAFKDLYFDVKFSNPFVNSYVYRRVTFCSEAYESKTTEYSNDFHQCLKLTFTYSLSYGRSLKRQDEIDSLDGAGSIMLKK